MGKPVKRPSALATHVPVSVCTAACPVRRLSLCSDLNEAELTRLNEISTTISFAPGKTILREGDPAEFVYTLVSGHVKLYKLLIDGRRQITGFLVPGDFVGLTNTDFHSFYAEALDPVVLCRFPRQMLESLMREIPALPERMLSIVSHELVEARQHALLLGRKNSRERVCSFLLSLMRRSGGTRRSAAGASLVALPMTRSDMADYLGLTTETVSRVLGELKRDGVICLPSRSLVEIPSVERLECLTDQA